MKFDGNGPPGEFASKALYKESCHHTSCNRGPCSIYNGGWKLSEEYFFSKEEAQVVLGDTVKWPVEMYDNSLVYVPDASEMK